MQNFRLWKTQISIRKEKKRKRKETKSNGQKDIFDRFYKSKNAGDKNFGIGLSLSRMIITNQNGVIKGIKKRLYTECELRPSEVLVLKKYIDNLESVIKEIREYINKNKLYSYKYDEEEIFEITTDEVAKTDLLQILDKGDK